MNSTQRRLHSYRPGRPLGEIRTPGLLGSATPVERDGRAEFRTSLSGVDVEASAPSRPRLVLLSVGPREISPELRNSALTLNLSERADWRPETIARVAAHLSRLPETRGLPLVLAGAGAGAKPVIHAAATLADKCAALLLDRPLVSEITLTPTYVGDSAGALAFLDDELGEVAAPGLNRAQRRRLARMLHRRVRRDCRRHGSGPLSGRMRRGIGTLAASLSFAFAFGLAGGTAQAAFSGTFNSGELVLADDASSSQVSLDCSAGGAVTFNGNTTLPGIAGAPCAAVKSIDIAGGAGNDTIDLDAVEKDAGEYEVLEGVLIDGAAGTDRLLGTLNVGGKMFGGNDGDTIYGSSGPDAIDAGGGIDLIDGDSSLSALADSADDIIDGGGGDDTLTQADTRNGIDYELSDGSFEGAGDDDLNSIERTNIVVTTGPNLVSAAGFSGPVSISTGDGDDTLAGGAVADTLSAGSGGNDRLLAGSHGGDQTLTAVTHIASGVTDTLIDFDQASLAGNAGPNAINASAFPGRVTIAGGAGTDNLTAGLLADSIDGGGDNDLLLAGGGNDTVAGGLGTDTVQQVGTTQTLSDTLLTGQGTDSLSGIERAVLGSSGAAVNIDASAFSGQTTLTGSINNDLFIGAQGSDSIDGGSGTFDAIEQNADVNMTLTNNLLTGVGNDALAGIEAATLVAGNGDNLLDASGFTGSRVSLVAGSGADTLHPANGSTGDDLDGGLGTDRLVHTATAATITLTDDSLAYSIGPDDDIDDIERVSLTGFSNNQDFDASGFVGGPVTIAALAGNDTIEGTDDHGDVLAAGTGSADRLRSFATENHVLTDASLGVGTASNDTLSGFDDASISSGSGNELLDAEAFTMPVTLFGNNGNDTLRGGGASDSLSGGTNGGTDKLEQTSNAVSQVLTNGQLTGDGTDTIISIERVSLTGGASGNSINVSAVSGTTGVTVSALGGPDTLETAGAFGSVFDGGAGDDSFDDNTGASLGGKVMIGGDGDDTISGSDGTDTITGGADDDDIVTSNQPQTVDAGTGNDTLSGRGTLIGGTGDDSLTTGGVSVTDSVVGGTGTDTFGRTGANPMNLTASLWSDGGSTAALSGIERAVLGAGVAGIDASGFTPGPVTLTGGTLVGSPNSDYLDGGVLIQTANVDQTLSDSLATGDGNDTLDTAGTGFNSAALNGGAGANDLDASGFSGNLTLSGGDANDTLTAGVATGGLSLQGGNGLADRAEVTIDGSTVILNDVSLDGQPHGGVENFSVSGGAADNNMLAGAFTKGSVTLAGLGGSDTLVGTGFPDVLDAGAGFDFLNSDVAGTQILSDTLFTVNGNSDTISGFDQADLSAPNSPASNDSLDAAGFSGPVNLNPRSGDDTMRAGAASDTLDGFLGNDRVVEAADTDFSLTDTQLDARGTDSLSSIEAASLSGGGSGNAIDASAFGGSETIAGLGGNDSIEGGVLVDGGLGDDTLDPGPSSSMTVAGGGGIDRIVEGPNSNQTLTDSQLSRPGSAAQLSSIEQASLSGSQMMDAGTFSGSVTLQGGTGNGDTLIGAAGADLLDANGGTGDVLTQTADADQVLNDTLLTGDGPDTLAGGFDLASLTGGASGNVLDASEFSGFVTLNGNNGLDTLSAGSAGSLNVPPGSHQLNGDGGVGDLVVEEGNAEQILDDGTLSRDGEPIGLNSIESASLTGTAFADTLAASGFTGFGGVTMDGLAGNDAITGSTRGDSLTGGSQADEIDGGGGIGVDTLVETFDQDLTLTDDSLLGATADDLTSIEAASLSGGPAANTFDASGFTAGPVSLNALAGNDVLTGSPQSDLIEARDGASFVDQINCLAGDDTLNADDVDNATNCEANGAIADTTAPQTAIASGPANGETILTASPSFTFTSNEPGSFSCQLDGGAVEACGTGTTGSKAYSGLADGNHTFRVFATDSAGNVEAPPSTRSFTVAVPTPVVPDPPLPQLDTSAPRLRISGSTKQKSSQRSSSRPSA